MQIFNELRNNNISRNVAGKRKSKDEYDIYTKSAVRDHTKGRAKGGQIVAIKKGLKSKASREWKYGILTEIITEEGKMKIISTYNNEGIKKTREAIEKVIEEEDTKEIKVLLVGDMNARIGLEDVGAEGETLLERKSEDKRKNQEGDILIDLCEENGYTILNGKIKGDEQGKMTYIGPKGASVIDYLIANEEAKSFVKEMVVEERVKSDHLPIIVTLKGGTTEKKKLKYEKKKKIKMG